MSSSPSLFLLFSFLSPRPKEDRWEIYLSLLSFLSSRPSSKLARPRKKERKKEEEREPSRTQQQQQYQKRPLQKKTDIKRTKTLFLLLLLLLQVPPRDPRKKAKTSPPKKGARSQRTFGYNVPPRMDRWTDSPHSPTPTPAPAPAPTRSQLLITRSTHQYQTSDIACSLAAPGFFFSWFFFLSSFFLSFCDQSQTLSHLLSSFLFCPGEFGGGNAMYRLFVCLLHRLLHALRRHGV